MSVHDMLSPFSHVVKFIGQDYEKIRTLCSQENVLWEDPKFCPAIGEVVWKRPWEISTSPCLLLEDGKHDVRKGSLDDGYLAAAMQALAGRPELLHWVVPQDQSCTRDNGGIVHFRIWQLGTWYDICVDDRLPTVGGKLAYIRSQDVNQFWCALLEKAYAKLHGSYRVLEVGHSADAMVDFTGGLSESMRLGRTPHGFGTLLLNAYEKDLLMCCAMVRMHEGKGRRSVLDTMKIFRDDRSQKFKDDHHYTVTKVQTHPKSNLVLVRIKDPEESSDCDKRLSLDSNMGTLDLKVDNDREFWISETDFKESFTTLNVCHLRPDTFLINDAVLGPSKHWWVNSFKGEWVRGVSAGGKHFGTVHLNNQYRIALVDTDDDDDGEKGSCSIVVSLIQKNMTRQLEWNLGFIMFKLEKADHLPEPLGYEFFTSNPHNFGFRLQENRREVIKCQNLLPGIYCIIPCTYERNEEAEFYLRVFTGKKAAMEKSDKRVSVVDKEPNIVHKLVEHRELPVTEESKTDDKVIQLFCELAGKDLTLDWEGLKIILDTQVGDIYQYSFVSKIFDGVFEIVRTALHYFFPSLTDSETAHAGPIRFSKNVCRTLISFMDESNSGKIGIDEFDKLWSLISEWKLTFRVHSKNRKGVIEPENLGKALENVGVILNMDVLGYLIHRYGDEHGDISFDDFIMCIASLQLDLSNFQDSDKENAGKVVVTLSEWIKKSFT